MATAGFKSRLRAAASEAPEDAAVKRLAAALGATSSPDKTFRFVGIGTAVAVAVVVCMYIAVRKLSGRGFDGYSSWKATTFAHAFVLNSIAVAVALGITTVVSTSLTHRVIERGDIKEGASSYLSVLTAGASTFLAYFILYVSFGFGGGMLTALGPTQTQVDAAKTSLMQLLPRADKQHVSDFISTLYDRKSPNQALL